MAPFASAPEVVFIGGPVSPEAVVTRLARARGPDGDDGWTPLAGGLGTIDVARDPLDLGVTLDDLRVFAGYAGWGPGQLEGELKRARSLISWNLRPGDTLRAGARRLVARGVAASARSAFAMLAHYPADTTVN